MQNNLYYTITDDQMWWIEELRDKDCIVRINIDE
jgi:hypothetical protein